MEESWRKFPCSKADLRLDITLKCGQSFRWNKKESGENRWIGVLKDKVWILKQNESHVFYKATKNDEKKDEEILKDYFQLKVNLGVLYEKWSKVDPVFEEIAIKFPGVRILRQDPVENLFSFICSANNNISRISGMVEKLCLHYGSFIAKIEDESYYAFPSINQLSKDPEALETHLRELGFGYRGSYIAKTAVKIQERGGEEYLYNLRKCSLEKARAELLELSGVGPKVADCVLLMSLDQPSAVPVDIHMFKIAANKYLPHLKGKKSFTGKAYIEVTNHFRNMYGDYAGWAQSVLFSADLKHLQDETGIEPRPSGKASKRRKK